MALSSPGADAERDACNIETDSNVALETAVAGASSQRLIVMLHDGALAALQAARAAIAQNDAGMRGAALSRAVAIIDEGLRPALDPKAGDEIAVDLLALYDYILQRLLYANLKAEGASIDEAARLMVELRGAWETLEHQAPQVAGSPFGQQPLPIERERVEPAHPGQDCSKRERSKRGRKPARNMALSYGRL